MGGHFSAYAVLGLGPDADSEEIERAYKRLIKLHHPDRAGGNAERAAELNRAYRELSGRTPLQAGLDFHEREPSPKKGRAAVRAGLVLVPAIAVLLLATGPVTALMGRLAPDPPREPARLTHGAAAPDAMDRPLDRDAVAGGAADALNLLNAHDDAGLLSASRDCHRKLRLQPSISALDRCAAFDDTVLQVQDRDPMWDRGPFSQLAVTGRQWSAASALSNDYLAADSRLERIRLQVELALAQRQGAEPRKEAR